MGAKVTFDSVNRLIIPNTAPVGGKIVTDMQVDVYSDGKEDWLADPTLNKFRFPVIAIGGQTTSEGKLGSTYLLRSGWHFRPYEASHEWTIDGNVFTDDASPLVVSTVGVFNVVVKAKVSTLVEIATDTSSAADLSLMRKIGTNKLVTDPVTGLMTLYDDDDVTVIKEWYIFEDVAETQTYQGQGIEVRKPKP